MIVASHLVFSTLKWGSNQIIQILHYYAVPTSFSLPPVPHAPRLIINPHDARRSVIYKFLTMVTKNMFTRRECGRKSLEKALTVNKTFLKGFSRLTWSNYNCEIRRAVIGYCSSRVHKLNQITKSKATVGRRPLPMTNEYVSSSYSY